MLRPLGKFHEKKKIHCNESVSSFGFGGLPSAEKNQEKRIVNR